MVAFEAMSGSTQATFDIENRRNLFRFGTRSLLIAMTLVTMGLGVFAAYGRCAAQRHERATGLANGIFRLQEQLETTFSSTPSDITRVSGYSNAQVYVASTLQAQSPSANQHLSSDEITDRILTQGMDEFAWNRKVDLDISKALATHSPVEVLERIAVHYEQGFSEHDLRQTFGSGGDTSQGAVEALTVWTSISVPPATTVYLRIRVDSQSNRASVQAVASARARLP